MMPRKLRALWMRLRGLFGNGRNDEDFAAELESHVALHTEDGIRAGLSSEEARRQALIRLGGMEQTRQAYRERRGLPWLETLWQDIRFGLRILCKNPGYTAIAVLTLALGIGANSAVFTVAQAAMLRSWPAREPDRMARLIATTPQGEEINFSYADYQDLAGQSRSLEGILAYNRRAKILRVGAESQGVLDDVVSPNYFSVLGIDAQLGRFFSAESRPDDESVVVISDSLWHRVFNADPSLVESKFGLRTAPIRFSPLRRRVFAASSAACPRTCGFPSRPNTPARNLPTGRTASMRCSGACGPAQPRRRPRLSWILSETALHRPIRPSTKREMLA